jgi:hypothetical protein
MLVTIPLADPARLRDRLSVWQILQGLSSDGVQRDARDHHSVLGKPYTTGSDVTLVISPQCLAPQGLVQRDGRDHPPVLGRPCKAWSNTCS